jgi:hypothetical protein
MPRRQRISDLAFWTLHAFLKVDYVNVCWEACIEQGGILKSVADTEVSSEKTSKVALLDPAAVCRSSDPMAVRELLTKIGDEGTFSIGPPTLKVILRTDGFCRAEGPAFQSWPEKANAGPSPQKAVLRMTVLG